MTTFGPSSSIHHILDVSQDGHTPTWPISHEAVLAICFIGVSLLAVIIMRWRQRNSPGGGIGIRACLEKLGAKLTGKPIPPPSTLPTSMTQQMLEARQTALTAPPPDIAETYFEPLPRYTAPSNSTHVYPPLQPLPPVYHPTLHRAPPYRETAAPLSTSLPTDDTPPATPVGRSGPSASAATTSTSSIPTDAEVTTPVSSGALS